MSQSSRFHTTLLCAMSSSCHRHTHHAAFYTRVQIIPTDRFPLHNGKELCNFCWDPRHLVRPAVVVWPSDESCCVRNRDLRQTQADMFAPVQFALLIFLIISIDSYGVHITRSEDVCPCSTVLLQFLEEGQCRYGFESVITFWHTEICCWNSRSPSDHTAVQYLPFTASWSNILNTS